MATMHSSVLSRSERLVYSDLSLEDKKRYIADIRATNLLTSRVTNGQSTLSSIITDAKEYGQCEMLLENGVDLLTAVKNQQSVVVQNVQGRQNRGQRNNTRGAGAAGYGGAHNRVGNAILGQAKQVKCNNCNGIGHIARNCTQPKRPQNSEYFKDKMLLMQAQENGVALDEEQLLFIAADDYDAFDSDVDEAPTTQTVFMANLSSADPVYDEAGTSYDSDILSEVHDHDHYQDAICEHHEEHKMHDDVQPNYVVDLHANYTSDSNMVPYDQYVKDIVVPVIQSNVSSLPNDAYMMIFNDMHEPHAQSVSDITRT
ncbi:retrovirus-related pol polyprotein from transposon TNT 1-94 [Tanacetum coccineum]